jgi:CIC family chloride channel protein
VSSRKRQQRRFYLRLFAHGRDLIHRLRASDSTFMVLAAIVIGLLGGVGAILIQTLIEIFREAFWSVPELSLAYLSQLPIYIRIGVPVLGSAIVGLIITYWAKEAKGHGVPEVMEAIALRDGIIRPRVVLAKLLASATYIGAGGSVGREGPVIQIGSAIGSTLGQFLHINPQRMKVFVACGAASGIAAAFNAPIAGAMFAIEVILGDFAVAQFSPIVIASVMATVVSRSYYGDHTAIIIPAYELLSPWELIPYAVLGLLSGLVALLFIRTLHGLEEFFQRWPVHQMVQIMLGGLGIGVLAYFVPNILGVGYETMDLALRGDIAWHMLFMLIFLKLIATSLSLASGGSGGVFAPSLFLGTMTGGFFGELVNRFWPGISASSGAYALVGMGAVVAGATHAPITAVIIIFEMTNDYLIILPLMIATIIATLLTTKVQKESIYTIKLASRGIDLDRGREVNLLRSIAIGNVLGKDNLTIAPDLRLATILEILRNTDRQQLYVIDKDEKLLGSIAMRDIQPLLGQEGNVTNLIIAMDIVNTQLPRLSIDDNLATAMQYFGKWQYEELPVVSGETLLGSLSRHQAIDAYNRAVASRNIGNQVTSSLKHLGQMESVPLTGEYELAEIHLPHSLIGKTLASARLRQKYGIQVILMKRRGSDGQERQFSPTPQEKLMAGDRLYVLGQPRQIQKLRQAP